MSKLLISQYYRELDQIIQRGGSLNENSIRPAFQNLLNNYLKPKNFTVVSELYSDSKLNKPIRLDGIIKDDLGLDWGYWEAKDPKDNLDQKIENKFASGYPNDNILFENSVTAILIQRGQETMRVSMKDPEKLDSIINAFINYIRPEVKQFRDAIELFKQDLPTILNTLRDLINKQDQDNQSFINSRNKFLSLCQEAINPNITKDDIREMMIQHILTEDIFLNIFNEVQFHRENNIARQLQEVINTFLTGATKRNLLSSIERYYNVIRSRAANIVDHHQKQEFLKIVYENFYKAYNPLSADRLGIVYTPNEIVKFMIESTDYLLHKHFNKLLEDPDVEILDPATGTGTFITEIIEYLNRDKLQYKYLNEIHCNEVAILPYYIANLNIEYTYKQKMGEYLEFHNICFVDTLDNTTGLNYGGKQFELPILSQENTERIKRQNNRKISVIIGNPPYNANQQNENDNNKNREYPAIDQRIKDTYIAESTAQKTKVYDMYSRFIRWATDRLGDNGIIAFITNSSFINARTFDGFRKLVSQEFSEIYIIDLDGDVRKNPKISGTSHNVFGIQTGIAISFLIKKPKNDQKSCKIFYTCRPDEELAIDKLKFLSSFNIESINFEHIIPDKNNNWINLADDNDFDNLIPLANKKTKLAKNKAEETAIFKLFSNGVNTARDEWIFDYNSDILQSKIIYFINTYNLSVENLDSKNIDSSLDCSIKWSADLKNSLFKKTIVTYERNKIITYCYRPFTKIYYYSEQVLSDRLTQNHYDIFSCNLKSKNKVIAFRAITSNKSFHCLATGTILDLHFTGDSQCLPLYTYDKNGNRIDNITDWGLQQFREYSQTSPPQPPFPRGEGLGVRDITKEDIFYYVYAVLHNPEYRKKYELNLKREFPRIPFYDDFFKWVNWGKQLMNLHLNYETIDPYQLRIVETLTPNPSPLVEGKRIKPKLKADKTKNQIILDDVTTLTDIPPLAWEYKLGNRSALEWILDQYKEKKSKDPTIAKMFNNYRFADYKETVIGKLSVDVTIYTRLQNRA
jgi:predicted helicase